MYNPKATSGNP